jgi:hypothetical protein
MCENAVGFWFCELFFARKLAGKPLKAVNPFMGHALRTIHFLLKEVLPCII